MWYFYSFSHSLGFLLAHSLFFQFITMQKNRHQRFYYVSYYSLARWNPFVSQLLHCNRLKTVICDMALCASQICQLCSTFYHIIFNWPFDTYSDTFFNSTYAKENDLPTEIAFLSLKLPQIASILKSFFSRTVGVAQFAQSAIEVDFFCQ